MPFRGTVTPALGEEFTVTSCSPLKGSFPPRAYTSDKITAIGLTYLSFSVTSGITLNLNSLLCLKTDKFKEKTKLCRN